LKKILIIDDDVEMLATVQELLSKNFQTFTATSGTEGSELAQRERPDLMIVDLHMPDLDGIAVCKNIRRIPELRSTPVIILSAAIDENLRTESFLWGADDFVSKPVSGRELMARVMSKLNWVRQPVDENTSVNTLGNLRIDHRKMQVTVDDHVIELTQFEYRLLQYFLDDAETVISRERLLKDVWKDSLVASRTIDTHIYSLRKKLSDFTYMFNTVHGSGYILKPS
jgi:DNA-binding response OmpR family regulator